MKLSQSRVVPLAIFTAITAAVMAILLFQGQLVFGQEDPVACVPNSSASIIVTDASSESQADVTEVSHGMRVAFRTILSVGELPAGEVACTFEGGDLSITLPNGESQELAGGSTGVDIPLVQVGSVYPAPIAGYTVNQADAANGVLVVTASYSNGVAHSIPEQEAKAPGENQFALADPSIEVAVTPPDQTVFEGGPAAFEITITNTGGYQLSNVQVSDSLDTNCDRNYATLDVRGEQTFPCQLTPAQEAQNTVTVTADVAGGPPEGQESVTATATASVAVEPVSIQVAIEPESQNVRLGESANLTITVTNPNSTDLVEVELKVTGVEGCDLQIGALGAADSGADSQDYECNPTLVAGTTMVTAKATGTVSAVGTEVEAEATAQVVVFDADIGIEIAVTEDTVRSGDTVDLTVTVTNHGDAELSNVTVVPEGDSAPGCAADGITLAPQQELSLPPCTSEALSADTEFVMEVTAIAPDGGPVNNSGSASVEVIHPNSDVNVVAVDSMSFRLVVHVLTITESNTGDTPLTDVSVDVDPVGITLTKDSAKQWIGGDTGDDGVLSPGETWEWRLVTVTLQGPSVALDDDAQTAEFTATGHGTDPLGGDITHPAYADELETLEVSIS